MLDTLFGFFFFFLFFFDVFNSYYHDFPPEVFLVRLLVFNAI